MWTWCSARRRCTACRNCWRSARRSARQQVDISFPEIEKFDHLPPARVDGALGVRLDHGRLLEILLVLRRALTRAGEEFSRPFEEVLDRSRRTRGPGRERGDAAGPERQRLPRARWAAPARSPTSRCSSSTSPRSPASSASATTTSHPNEFTQRLVDVYAKVPQLCQPPAPARAARQRPHPRRHEARLHGARIQEHDSQDPRGAPGHQPVDRLHRRLPRRDRRRPRPHDEADRGTSASIRASASSSAPRPRHAGPLRCTTTRRTT